MRRSYFSIILGVILAIVSVELLNLYAHRPAERLLAPMTVASLPIDSVSGGPSFILPGDHVDILLTRNVGGEARKLITNVILQDVEVLGINRFSNQNTEKPVVGETATLEVTPEQVQRLALTQQAGRLSLALRYMAPAP